MSSIESRHESWDERDFESFSPSGAANYEFHSCVTERRLRPPSRQQQSLPDRPRRAASRRMDMLFRGAAYRG